MRPVEFTSEAIIQAGQDLQNAGRNITGLREIGGATLPGRSRFGTSTRAAWQAVAEPVAEAPKTLPRPWPALSLAHRPPRRPSS